MEMNEGARRANEDTYRRRHLTGIEAVSDKLDTAISLLKKLTELLERTLLTDELGKPEGADGNDDLTRLGEDKHIERATDSL